jgi:probable HAF family extracellular repeat protein
MRDLGTLGGPDAAAYAINARGQVAGTSARRDGAGHAFLWDKGSLGDLGTLGGAWSNAMALTESGDVLGTSAASDGWQHAFRWSSGSMHDLGSIGSVSHHSKAEVIAMNGLGWAVGTEANQGANSGGHAILWMPGAGVLDLNRRVDARLGWRLVEADAVNNSGEVAGFGYHHGKPRAFLLVPRPSGRTPLPTSRRRPPRQGAGPATTAPPASRIAPTRPAVLPSGGALACNGASCLILAGMDCPVVHPAHLVAVRSAPALATSTSGPPGRASGWSLRSGPLCGKEVIDESHQW